MASEILLQGHDGIAEGGTQMMLLVAAISFLAGMFWGVMLIVLLILRRENDGKID